jgi:hypothetical protein
MSPELRIAPLTHDLPAVYQTGEVRARSVMIILMPGGAFPELNCYSLVGALFAPSGPKNSLSRL